MCKARSLVFVIQNADGFILTGADNPSVSFADSSLYTREPWGLARFQSLSCVKGGGARAAPPLFLGSPSGGAGAQRLRGSSPPRRGGPSPSLAPLVPPPPKGEARGLCKARSLVFVIQNADGFILPGADNPSVSFADSSLYTREPWRVRFQPPQGSLGGCVLFRRPCKRECALRWDCHFAAAVV